MPHLWVILTKPDGNPPEIVIVNLTSRKPDSDATVVLNVGDHRYIDRETVVFYTDARLATSDTIAALSSFPDFGFHDDCSAQLLEKIQRGLLVSRDTPKGIKAYCRERFGFAEGEQAASR